MASRTTDPLLERDLELSAIGRALAGARAGDGACVVVAGAPGIGKTRLLDAARELAAAQAMTVLRARGDELEHEFPFGAAVQLFAPAARRDDAPELFAGAARLAAPLLDANAPAPAEDDVSSVFHGLHWLTANLAESAPLLLCIDDLQWVDRLSLRFLLYLAQRLEELPVAIVAAVRPADAGSGSRLPGRLAAHPASVRLEPAPLSEAAVAALVEDALGGRAHPRFAAACSRVTHGNPLFVRELLAAAAAERVVPTAAAADRVDELGGRSVGGAVLRRIAALPEAASRLAAAVAVLGDGCRLSDAAELAGIDADAAAAAADQLADAGVLLSGARPAFVHPVMREAVDGALPPARRHRLHLRAAALLRGRADEDPERVAEHLVRAGGEVEPWAVEAARHGAHHARARGAPAAAARYLRAVAAGGGQLVLEELAFAEVRAGDDGAPARALAAVAGAAAGRERGELGLRLGLALLGAGRHAAAVETFDRALEGLPPHDAVALALRAERSAAAGLGGLGGAVPALGALAARAGRGEVSRSERAILAHGALTAGLQGTSAAEATRLARAALDGLEIDAARSQDMVTAALAVSALLVADELEEVERLTSGVIAQARTQGVVIAFATASHLRAHGLERQGRLQEAIADAQSAIDAQRYGWEVALPAAHAVLALALIERGEFAAAEVAVEIPDGERRFGDTLTWSDLLEARARLLLALGRPADALPVALEAGRRLETMGMAHAGVVPWRGTAARAALAGGDAAQAAQLADEDLRAARAFGAPRELGSTLRTAAAVAGGDRGIALLREAVAVLAPSAGRLEHAHALADLGHALLGAAHPLAARAPLREALDLASACGASMLEKRARQGLVAAGARPRRPRTSGRDALTPREERLVSMAASGMTNREIAEALFITKKTVESHLAHAFRKLGVSSRAALRDAVTP